MNNKLDFGWIGYIIGLGMELLGLVGVDLIWIIWLEWDKYFFRIWELLDKIMAGIYELDSLF